MKKFLPLIVGVVLLILMPSTAFAHSNSHYGSRSRHHGNTEHAKKTEVTGTISFNSEHVGKGIPVTVVCNGYSQSTKTNKHGQYSVMFAKGQCDPDDTITVTTTVNGVTGTSTGKTTREKCHVNIAVINVSVPEYGLLGLTGAIGLGGGALIVIRRRQLDGHHT